MPTMSRDSQAPTNDSSEVEDVGRRRTFTAAYKRRIVTEIDACTRPGEIGAILRREGLYSSHISKWRQLLKVNNGEPRKRGRKPRSAAERKLAELEKALERERREKARLAARLEKTQIMLELQKKVAELLEIPLDPPPIDESDEPRS